MVPDIQSETDRICCHFRPFFVILPTICPSNDPEKSKLKKKKKKEMSGYIILLYIRVYYKETYHKKLAGDIIISYRCTINVNYMMYDTRDKEHVGDNVLSFWTILCPFTPFPLTN